MNVRKHLQLNARALSAAVSAVVASCAVLSALAAPAQELPKEDIARILDQAEAAAMPERSLLRVNAEGQRSTTRMHIVVVDRSGRVVGQRSMPDAWLGSIAVARSKAFTALAFSSNENALTTRSLGALTQPGGPL